MLSFGLRISGPHQIPSAPIHFRHFLQDILMLDELRRLASACCGRLQVFHTLSRSPGARSSRSRTRLYFSGCHQHFRQEMEDMEEVSTWEGHVDEEMMRKAFEMGFGTGKMTNATRIVVCGDLVEISKIV